MKLMSILFAVSLLCTNLFAQLIEHRSANIVGHQSEVITEGRSRITASIDAIHIFPTLGDVIRFNPARSVIGDRISFVLDGKHQTYIIKSYDETNYWLKASKKERPDNITLHGIPYLKTFEIFHISTNRVEVCNSGEAQFSRTPFQGSKIKVEYISDEDGSVRSLE